MVLDGARSIEGDSLVKIWDARAGKFESSLDTSQASVRFVGFHPGDDLFLLVLDDRDCLRLCQHETDRSSPMIRLVEGVREVRFVEGGKKVVVYGRDGLIKTWDTDELPLQGVPM